MLSILLDNALRLFRTLGRNFVMEYLLGNGGRIYIGSVKYLRQQEIPGIWKGLLTDFTVAMIPGSSHNGRLQSGFPLAGRWHRRMGENHGAEAGKREEILFRV